MSPLKNKTCKLKTNEKNNNFKLDEINLLFQPNMRSKLLWFYQEVDEPEAVPVPEVAKPGPSRAAASNTSKTPQGEDNKIYVPINGFN